MLLAGTGAADQNSPDSGQGLSRWWATCQNINHLQVLLEAQIQRQLTVKVAAQIEALLCYGRLACSAYLHTVVWQDESKATKKVPSRCLGEALTQCTGHEDRFGSLELGATWMKKVFCSRATCSFILLSGASSLGCCFRLRLRRQQRELEKAAPGFHFACDEAPVLAFLRASGDS